MATYRTVQLSFWTDPKVDDDFTPEDKYFYLYLLTNPHTNICGCYEISMKQMVRETGYNEDTVKRLLARMETVHHVIVYDSATKEVLIPNWHKYNWFKSKDVFKGVETVASTIKSDGFRMYILNLLANIYEHPLQGVYRGSIDPRGTSVTVPVTDTVTDPVIEQEPKKKKQKVAEGFDIFWEAYPRKTSKAEAVKAWNKIRPTEALVDTMIESIEKWKKTEQWRDPRYIPHPSTWLNQERWNDEVPEQPKTFNGGQKNHGSENFEQKYIPRFEDMSNLIGG